MIRQAATMAHRLIIVEQYVFIQVLVIETFKYTQVPCNKDKYKISLIIYDKKKGCGSPFK